MGEGETGRGLEKKGSLVRGLKPGSRRYKKGGTSIGGKEEDGARGRALAQDARQRGRWQGQVQDRA